MLAAIAEAEAIEVAEEEMVEALAHTAEHERTTPEKLLERLRENGRDAMVREDIAVRKAIDLVAESAKPIPLEQAEAREKIWTPEKEEEEKPSELLDAGRLAVIWRRGRDLRALEEESERFSELSGEMFCVAGFDGFFKRVNPAFERILGYSREELLSRPFVEFVHPDDREDLEVEAAGISVGGRAAVRFRNRYLDKEGGVHWIEWRSVGVPEEERIYAVGRDVTDRKILEQQLELRSRSDPLTGMLNRRSFDESLAAQLAHARRYKRSGALLIVDLDRFKQVNDEFGHAVGDEALRLVSRVLAENLRETDMVGRDEGGLVARLGGDEFALLLPETDAAGVEAVAGRLVAALAAEPLVVGEREVQLGFSIGAATFGPSEARSAEELLAAADRAMYVVKAAGGGGASIESRP